MLDLKLTRLWLVRIIFTLALLLLAFMSSLLLRRINRQVVFADQANRTNLVRIYAEHLLSGLQSLEAGQRGFLLTKDSAFLYSFLQNRKEIMESISTLDSLSVDSISDHRIENIRQLTGRRMYILDSVLQVHGAGTPGMNVQRALDPGKAVTDSIKRAVNLLEQSKLRLLHGEQKLKERYRFITPRIALVLILFALAVFTLSYFILNRQLRLSKAYLQQKDIALNNLKETNMIYQNAEEVANLGSWQLNLATNMFKCSENLFRIYGSEPRAEQISFDRFLSFVVPEDRENLVQSIRNAADTDSSVETKYRITRSDGAMRYMRAIGRGMQVGDDHILLGATQDITVISETVQKLQASEQFNRNITELVPDIIYVYDLDHHKMLFLNTDPKDVIGFTYEELINEDFNFFQLFHADDLEQARSRQNRYRNLKDGEVISAEYRMRHKNGEWKYIYARNTTFKRNEKGEVIQLIGVGSDITKLVKANERLFTLNRELAQKNKELKQTNDELSSFTFLASHDLQEPLRKIQTFVSFLTDSKENLSETSRFYLERLQHAAIQIRTLIQDILSYSTITQSGEQWESVDLNSALHNAIQSLYGMISDKDADIHAEKLPVIQGNISQMQKLFENLLHNGIKYKKPGIKPVISITYEMITNENRSITDLGHGTAYHKISFADNGIGFDQEYSDVIFDLFKRLHSKSEYDGSGIGLALCKKIIQIHGGNIVARSAPGEGSVFDIYIPVSTAYVN